MDSAELLDLLGNANRRRILRLLARKPCYVTEISEYLGVSPKAVIDHLRKLEEAGLVESRTDDRRRKYFSIARNLRLEVNVSPYEFGTKSAYPASSELDMKSCRYLQIDIEPNQVEKDPAEDLVDLADTLGELEQLERELSLAQRWVQGQLSTVREEIADSVEGTEPRLVTDLLAALSDGKARPDELARTVEAPPSVIEDLLRELAERGVVSINDGNWSLGN